MKKAIILILIFSLFNYFFSSSFLIHENNISENNNITLTIKHNTNFIYRNLDFNFLRQTQPNDFDVKIKEIIIEEIEEQQEKIFSLLSLKNINLITSFLSVFILTDDFNSGLSFSQEATHSPKTNLNKYLTLQVFRI